MLNVAVHAGDDKRKEINLSPKTEQNVRNFLIELAQIMQKNNVTLEINDAEIHEKNVGFYGFLENNYDTFDVTLDDEVLLTVEKADK
jgi:hypothetical protein